MSYIIGPNVKIDYPDLNLFDYHVGGQACGVDDKWYKGKNVHQISLTDKYDDSCTYNGFYC